MQANGYELVLVTDELAQNPILTKINKLNLKQVSNFDLLKELERRMLINHETDPQGIDFYPKRGIIETEGEFKVNYSPYGSKLEYGEVLFGEKAKEDYLRKQSEIKNSPNFYQQAPFLTIAEDLLKLIKEGKVELLIFLSAYDKRKFPNGDPRKKEIFAETFARLERKMEFKDKDAGVCVYKSPEIILELIPFDKFKVIAPYYPAIADQHDKEVLLIKNEVNKNGKDYLILKLDAEEVIFVFSNLKEGEEYTFTVKEGNNGSNILVDFEGQGILNSSVRKILAATTMTKKLHKQITKKLEKLQQSLENPAEVRAIEPDDPNSDALYDLVEKLKEILKLLENKENEILGACESKEFPEPRDNTCLDGVLVKIFHCQYPLSCGFSYAKNLKMVKRIGKSDRRTNIGLSANATPIDKAKYKLCKSILSYKKENNFATKDIAQQLGLTIAKTESILYSHVDKLAFEELVHYANNLHVPCQLRINLPYGIKAYKLVWCVTDNEPEVLGLMDCYRQGQKDKKKE
ncbi:15108_t:CDS:10 [Entrophospora sp. SA101]|nr:15108_t:CDS:10 [Entrophospora sp. SA101]